MAAEAGATAVLVLPPYYIAASRAGILAHFRDVAAAGGLPIVAYNNPPRTARDIDAELLLELAELPQVVGLKECDRDLGRASAKIAVVGDRIAFMCGDDDLVFPMLAAGASGAIMALPNLAPQLCCSLYEACRAGDVESARELHEVVRKLVHVRRIPNHPGPLKETMAMVGRPVGLARRPLLAMTDGERAAVQAVVDALGPRLC
jgi:4-hydroxy-tetrahydrodipicolinate synthase